MVAEEALFMQRALQLASLGVGAVSPNPLVGCVIVRENKIIAEGWHEKYGEAHAEINALRQLPSEEDLSQADIYVNLEPCAHFGKTPPCADQLVLRKPRRVIIANQDPNPLVAGKGIEKLRNAGIEVITEVEKERGLWLNRRFFTYITQKRPYIILKWAVSKDGFIAPDPEAHPYWITQPIARALVHQWRTEEDAIMVGSKTVIADNPQLNVREAKGRNPTRVVIDRKCQLMHQNYHILDTKHQKTIIYNTIRATQEPNQPLYRKIDNDDFLPQTFADLATLGIQSVMVEGGKILLEKLLALNLWDEIRLFQSHETLIRKGIVAPQIPTITPKKIQMMQKDTLFIYESLGRLWEVKANP